MFYIGGLPTVSWFSSAPVLHAVQMFPCAYFSSGFLEQSGYSLECIFFLYHHSFLYKQQIALLLPFKFREEKSHTTDAWWWEEGCCFCKCTGKSNNSNLFHCPSSEDIDLESSTYPDDGSQSMIYRPLLKCKIILNTPELVCKFSYTIFINSAVIILHNCLEGLRITGVELPTELCYLGKCW